MARRVLVAMVILGAATVAGAQGVSSAGVRGTATSDGGRGVDARISITHAGTGFTTQVRATGGRYLVQGLDPGGPYTVRIRAVGFTPQRAERVFLRLGELREIDFVLLPLTPRLDTVTVVATGPSADRTHAGGGAGTTIPQALLDELPTLNRDVYDFVRLVPQISAKIGLPNPGLSAGGAGFRYNDFLINGVSERTLSGRHPNGRGRLAYGRFAQPVHGRRNGAAAVRRPARPPRCRRRTDCPARQPG
jgi:hypothetical protein